jgi:hypothetical protein
VISRQVESPAGSQITANKKKAEPVGDVVPGTTRRNITAT